MRTRLIAGLVLCFVPPLARGGENLSAEALLPAHGATEAARPAAAFGKGVYLVVWEAGRNENADLVGVRVDRTGKVLDAKPFVVSDAEEEQARPRVAFGGGHFLVVWQYLCNGADYDTYAARVSVDGKVLDADGLAIAAAKENQCQPDVVWEGTAFQVIWRGYEFRKGDAYDMWGARVSTGGKSLDGAGAMLLERGHRLGKKYGHPPGVGSNGKGDVVVAARLGGYVEFQAVRGNKPVGKHLALEHRSHWEPRFVSDGEKHLALFTTTRPMGRGGTAKVCSGAVLLDPKVVAKGGKTQAVIALSTVKTWKGAGVRNPAGAWDGSSYLVAWDMKQGPTGTQGERAKKWAYDRVYARRVSKDGKALGEMIPVAGEMASPARHAAAASSGAGATLLAYEKHPAKADEPIRIGFRVLGGE